VKICHYFGKATGKSIVASFLTNIV